MKKAIFKSTICALAFSSANLFADGFVEGIPVVVQKSDYGSIHLIYVQFDKPVAPLGCTTGSGVVVLDSNESSKPALSMALAAQASGKKFRCYVVTNQCSQIDGSVATVPICGYYPAIVN
ncbi:MAG: hypothetical protein EOO07_19970 [Chitinophagaceae bacterium]|nr:MAG: hypothetical protein EOO07_19970 [Chitinophagaceae bacterium]